MAISPKRQPSKPIVKLGKFNFKVLWRPPTELIALLAVGTMFAIAGVVALRPSGATSYTGPSEAADGVMSDSSPTPNEPVAAKGYMIVVPMVLTLALLTALAIYLTKRLGHTKK